MEYKSFKLDLAQLGGLLLAIVSIWNIIRKNKKRREKERADEDDQTGNG